MRPEKQQMEHGDLSSMFGQTCRDCINRLKDLRLVRTDCRYSVTKTGHRIKGPCAYCGRNMPLVMGFTVQGWEKITGHTV